MSSEEQADAYIEEAQLTMESAEAIYSSGKETGEALWAQVVKNGYDAIEQAVSAGIAAENEAIPRNHPGKINTFIELYKPPEEIEDLLLQWLHRRSSSQYVDIREDKVNVPHEMFDLEDAKQILGDAETVFEYVQDRIS